MGPPWPTTSRPEQRRSRVAPDKIREERIKYLTDEKRIKALTVMFSDLEGRLHMLDYSSPPIAPRVRPWPSPRESIVTAPWMKAATS